MPSKSLRLDTGVKVGRSSLRLTFRSLSSLLAWLAKYLVMILLLFFMTIPIIWMYSSAFRPAPEIFKYVQPLGWHTFVPEDFTVRNFVKLLTDRDLGIPRAIVNSILVASSTVLLGGLVNALAAYAFARLRFPGRDLIFAAILLTILVPFEALLIPLFLMMKQIGWLDSYQALILPSLANAFNIFLLRQFFLGFPRDLEEAAIVDGASRLEVFFRVVVPLSWPALISCALITFQASWDAFLWPIIATTSTDMRVIQVAVSSLVTQDATYWDSLFAGVAIAAAIPIVLFLVFQRYYTEGITTTGLVQ